VLFCAAAMFWRAVFFHLRSRTTLPACFAISLKYLLKSHSDGLFLLE
jgi:hypothetical protein